MGKESIVEIPPGSGNHYRYEYDESSGKTLYRGPVGDAPQIGEEEFLRLVHDIAIEPKITISEDEYGNVNRNWNWEMKWTPYDKKKDNGRILISAYKTEMPPIGQQPKGYTTFGLQIGQTSTPKGHHNATIYMDDLTDEQRMQLTMAVDQASKWLVHQLLTPEKY